MVTNDPQYRWLVWVQSEDVHSGQIDEFVKAIEGADRYDGEGPTAVYTLDPTATHLVAVAFTTTRTPFNDDDYAAMTVTVTFPDGETAEGSYTVDGRA